MICSGNAKCPSKLTDFSFCQLNFQTLGNFFVSIVELKRISSSSSKSLIYASRSLLLLCWLSPHSNIKTLHYLKFRLNVCNKTNLTNTMVFNTQISCTSDPTFTNISQRVSQLITKSQWSSKFFSLYKCLLHSVHYTNVSMIQITSHRVMLYICIYIHTHNAYTHTHIPRYSELYKFSVISLSCLFPLLFSVSFFLFPSSFLLTVLYKCILHIYIYIYRERERERDSTV
jgi:hypothetical protein